MRQSSKIGLETPSLLSLSEHSVPMGVVVLLVDVGGGNHNMITHLPFSYRRTCPDDDSRCVRADDVVRQVVTLLPAASLAHLLEELECGDRFEHGRPHSVVVNGTGHDGNQRLIGRQIGHGYLVNDNGLAYVLVLHGLKDVDVFLAHSGSREIVWDREAFQVRCLGTSDDRFGHGRLHHDSLLTNVGDVTTPALSFPRKP